MPQAHFSPAAAEAPLPIDGLLGAIETALGPPGSTLLLQAPPGAGKTTRVPLALLHALPAQGIVMLEPRRLATRAAADRLASTLGEAVGEQVGYRVRLESRCSSRTRLEVVTSGLFLRRLQNDPALEGVGLVIFDEFHERQADADLALALLRQARTLLRPDLRVLVMSATLDLEPLAAELDQAQVLTSEGRSHPVSVEHQRPRESEAIERQVLRALEQQWLPQRHAGETALIFLPGLREIQRSQRLLESCPWSEDVAIYPLHGSLPLEAQRQAIAPADPAGAKLVLATNIAESSLTIEGVRLVIDAGWSRRSRFDPGTGMDGLVTVPASQASAEQRRGRAGRLGPGRCLRLWSPAEQQRRPAFDPPELLEVDPLPIALQLAQWGAGLGEVDPLPIALQLAQWGAGLGEELAWLTPPPLAGLQEARRLLEQLGALDQSGALSDHGRALSAVGLHPRLAHLLLKASAVGDLDLACDLAVLLSERDPLDRQEHGSDLLRRLAWMRPQGQGRRGSGPQQRLHQLAAELRRQVRAAAAPASGAVPGPADLEWRAARLITWAYPERIALRRPGSPHRYQLRSGRGATLHPNDPLVLAEALAVAVLDGHCQDAAIRLAVPLPAALLEELAVEQGVSVEEVRWDNTAQRVRCERSLRLGALVLERSPWPDADEARVRQALLEGLRQRGLEALPWGARSRQLQQRLLLAHQHLGSPWPDCSDQALSQTLEDWLSSHLQGVRSLEDLQRLDLCEVLWADLDWTQRRLLDDWLPQQLTVPSGRRIALTYQNGEVVLAVKLQEMFGCRQTPALLQGQLPVTVHLLSPAGRPAAITRDLSGFWEQGYAEVRRDLRGRYPRHPWPEDPRQAQATAQTKARLAREQREQVGPPAPQG